MRKRWLKAKNTKNKTPWFSSCLAHRFPACDAGWITYLCDSPSPTLPEQQLLISRWFLPLWMMLGTTEGQIPQGPCFVSGCHIASCGEVSMDGEGWVTGPLNSRADALPCLQNGTAMISLFYRAAGGMFISAAPSDTPAPGFITSVFSNLAKLMQLYFCKIWVFSDLELTLSCLLQASRQQTWSDGTALLNEVLNEPGSSTHKINVFPFKTTKNI